MRVAFIGGFAFSPKGTIRARAHPLAAQLVSVGHEVTIFLTPYDNPDHCGRDWEQEGVRVRNMAGASSSLATSYWHDAALLGQLIKDVTSFQPDLIHVFKPKGFAGAAGTYFLKRHTCPLVLDCDDWEGWGGWNDVKPYSWIVKQYIDSQERWMIRRAPAVTVASRVLEERATDLRGNRKRGIYYIPNCGSSRTKRESYAAVRANSQTETKTRLGLPNVPIVLYSGHFDAGEDASFFCRAAAATAEQHNACIVFVGDGPELSRVKEYFYSRPTSRTFFFPQMQHAQFLEFIWASDITAFPYPDDAVHRAKCSARIVDYMAMGKPVLTSAVGQNLSYIVDGKSGVLVRAGDAQQFSHKLDLLLTHTHFRDYLGKNARARIEGLFRWDGAALRNCIAAYEHVLADSTVFPPRIGGFE